MVGEEEDRCRIGQQVTVPVRSIPCDYARRANGRESYWQVGTVTP